MELRKILIFSAIIISGILVYQNAHATYGRPVSIKNVPLPVDGEISVDTIVSKVNLDTSSLRIEDSEGHEWDVKPDSSGKVHLTGSDMDLATDTNLSDTLPREVVQKDGDFLKVSSNDLISAESDSVQIFTRDTQGNLQGLRSTPGGLLKTVSETEDTFIVTVKDYTGDSIPVESLNQDTNVSITNIAQTEKAEASDSGDTGIKLTSGDTYEVDFGSPVSYALVQVSSDTGEITVTDGGESADDWDMSVFSQSAATFERTKPQFINIKCIEDATVKWRYER